jgi:hypothetical protein
MSTKQEIEKFIEEKCPGAKPLLIAVRGSQAYGTATPSSNARRCCFINDIDRLILHHGNF